MSRRSGDLATGTEIASRFVIEALAGRGGMSAVYRARDKSDGRVVALKIFTDRETHAHERFLREAEILATLRHPAVVLHVSSGIAFETPYLAMEWLSGEDLADRLLRGPLAVADLLVLGERIASALGLAHARGIVHRDIKPANIFLPEGEIGAAKLLDFGIARVRGGAQFTRFGEALGTPAYMAPEQAKGAGEIDARADVFALGCVLFEALVGKPPFWAEHPLAVMAKILMEDAPKITTKRNDAPAPLVALIERMLAKDPSNRPKDAAEVARELARIREIRKELPAVDVEEETSLTGAELSLLSVLLVGGIEQVRPSSEDLYQPTMLAETSSGELETLHSEVLRHGGWAERLIDGTIVVNLPGRGASMEQAAEAARCALSIRAAMPLHPIALATGRAELSGGFPVGEVIDRGVALLARAVAASSGAPGVLIDEVTAGLLDRGFEIRAQDKALALTGARDLRDAPRTLLGKPQPFVGRERELTRLLRLFEASAQEPAAHVVVCVGQNGYGKSRFAYELGAALESHKKSPSLLVARADPSTQRVPLGVVSHALSRLFGVLAHEPPEVQQHRVRARVGRHVRKADRERVAPLLGELVGVRFEPASAPHDAVKLGDQIRAAWEDFLAAELERGPVVVLIDDLQSADTASVQLLDAALRTFAERPLFVVAFASPELDVTFPQLWVTRSLLRIELARLPEVAARSLVRSAIGDVPGELEDRLLRQADGNVLHLEELIRAVAAGHHGELPETVLAMLQGRLEAQSSEARRVLRACSILGDGFSAAAVAALCGEKSVLPVRQRLEELIAAELLELLGPALADDGLLGFRTAALREAAYATVTEADRRRGHRLAADWLERRGASRDAIVVAEHLEKAADGGRAAIWYARAAETALEGNDFDAADQRAERGALLGAHGPLLGRIRLLQSEAHRHAGQNSQLLARSDQALSLLPWRTPPWWTAAANAVLATIRLGHDARLDELCAAVTEAPLTDLPSSATRAAHYLQFAGREAEANQLLTAAMQKLGSYELDPSMWAWGYRAYATKALLRGEVGTYAEQLDLAVSGFARAGDEREVASERVNLGFARMELGLYEDARAALLEGLGAAERLGLKHVAGAALQNLAALETRTGQLAAAHTYVDRAIAIFAAQGNRRMEGNTRMYRSRLYAREGRADVALSEADVAVELLRSISTLLPSALAARARALLALGRPHEALSTSRESIAALARSQKVDEGESLLRLVAAETMVAAKLEGEAREVIVAARDRLLQRAASVRDPAWRASFLERVEENRRTLALAETLFADEAPG